MNYPAERLRPSDLVAEYTEKQNALPALFQNYIDARDGLEMGCSVMGAYGGDIWRSSHSAKPQPDDMQKTLRKSAWRRLYQQWIKQVATAKDKSRIETMLENPPEFTIENIREQFGVYVLDPWGTVLRGLAEVFCGLDPYYKSHTKVAIGAKGLPKRVIITGFNGWVSSSAEDRMMDIINALRAYRREPLIEWAQVRDWSNLAKTEDRAKLSDITNNPEETDHGFVDDLELRRFRNGNGHIYFGSQALEDINKSLAEYYGDVLPDVEEEQGQRQASTEVSKDLQYYPTPESVAENLLYDIHITKGDRVLEPSCGCGRIMDAVANAGGDVFGIEYDCSRASQARAKGHNVRTANFLELEPAPEYDYVIMNPPFYGKHYLKHIEAALRWLKPGGRLVAILPATARYDHKIIDDEWLKNRSAGSSGYETWRDLPVGAFSESGTNVNTTVLKAWSNRA